jgi:hypothetical protein
MRHPSPTRQRLTSIHTQGHGSKPGPLRVRAGVKVLLAAVALGGVVAGHAVGHLVAVPSPAARHTVLAEMGQVRLPVATVLALAVSLYAAGSMALRRARAGAEGRTVGADICHWFAARLAATQLLLYVVGEAMEPMVPGAPLAHFLQRGVLLRGLLAQLLVALLGTLLLAWLARAATLVGRLLARPPRLIPAGRWLLRPVVDQATARAMFPGPLTARGPPA